MLFLLRNYPLVPAFRLKSSVLPVATRRFLATTSDNPPSGTQKPHRFFKKDLRPPMKRPMSGYIAFAKEFIKGAKETYPKPVLYKNLIRDASTEWKKLSDAEQKAYFPPPGAYEEYRANLQKWYESLDDDAKKALKTYRRRKRGSGFGLFISEAWKSSQAGSIGERISELSKVYKSFSDEKRAEYTKRAHETLFGARAERAAKQERALARVAQAKIRQKEKLKAVKEAKKLAEKRKAAARREALLNSARKKAAAKQEALKKLARKQRQQLLEKKAAEKKEAARKAVLKRRELVKKQALKTALKKQALKLVEIKRKEALKKVELKKREALKKKEALKREELKKKEALKKKVALKKEALKKETRKKAALKKEALRKEALKRKASDKGKNAKAKA